MSYYKPPKDGLRRLLELRSFTAVVNQTQRDAERTSLDVPTEEQIANQIIEEVPLSSVKKNTFERLMVDLYDTNGRDLDRDKDGECNVWFMRGVIVARSCENDHQIRPSFLDPDLNRYDNIKE